MKLREISPVTRLLAGSICYLAAVAGAMWMLGGEAWQMFRTAAMLISAILSPFFGAFFVWSIVRRANRRHDRKPSE